MAVFICQRCGAEQSTWGGRCPQCGGAETIRLAPSADRLVDRVLKGKYKLLRKLGQGGMGAVYLAEQLGIGHQVAVKFLKSEFSSDAEIARRFLNEAKSYALVAHPNAVAFHDFGQDDEGNLFIAMEYCDGVDLKKVIAERGRLPLGEAADIVLQVADVLSHAHGKGVVHRDLKPENVMIRRGLRGVHAKVLDFGIARLMDAGTRLTVAGAIAGTPRYMSPEQVEGKDVDHRADIYSLGIVLYECLTGRQPFDGGTIADILRKQAVQPMPTLASAAAELDLPGLEAVVQRACAKPRDQRFPDMAAFAVALSQALPTQLNLGVAGALTSPGTSGALATAPHQGREATPSGLATDVGRGRGDTGLAGPTPSAVTTVDTPTHLGARGADFRSRTPLVIAGLVGLCAALGVGLALTRAPADAPVPPGLKPLAPPPTPTVTPPSAPPPAPTVAAAAPPPDTAVLEAARMLREEGARVSLGKGRTEFEVGKLAEAETYLRAVEAETGAAPEARRLLDTIDAIRAKLGQARALKASGDCARALPLFKAVLALNPRVDDATRGVSACRAGTVDTTME